MAATTQNLVFTTAVYVAPVRDLISVARSVGTAAVLSGNRVRLGIGVGWCKEEFDQTGQDFATRGKRLDEMIVALRALWQGGWVEYHGQYYDVPECQMEPAPDASPCPSSAAATPPSRCAAPRPCATAGSRPGPTARRRPGSHLGELRAELDQGGPRGPRRLQHLPVAQRAPRPSTCTAASRTPASPTSCARPGCSSTSHRERPTTRRSRRAPRRRALVRRGHRPQGLTRSGEARGAHVKTMKIGLQLGYWGAGPPAERRRARHGSRPPRL